MERICFFIRDEGCGGIYLRQEKEAKPDTVIANQSADWCGNPFSLEFGTEKGFFVLLTHPPPF